MKTKTQLSHAKHLEPIDPSLSRSHILLTIALLVAVSSLISCSSTPAPPPPPPPPAISVSVAPQNPTVQVNQPQPFTATVTPSSQSQSVTWSLSGTGCTGAACGVLNNATANSVTYTAPANVPSSTVTITATSSADSTKKGTSTITVSTTLAISVSVAPLNPSIQINQSQPFTATVTPSSQSQAVTWSLACTGVCGTLNSTSANPVTYTAPSAVPGSTVTITATSSVDNTKKGTSIITVTSAAAGFTGVTTWHNDNSRSGLNTQETTLTLANVNMTTFGKLFSCTVDSDVYAQPLYVPNLAITGKGTHNVIFVATEKNTVYAFDADTSPCTTLWQVTLLPNGETALDTNSGDGCTETVSPDIGITGTPVIDLSTKTLYVVTTSKNSSSAKFQRLHALPLDFPATQQEKAGSPATIQATISGISFDPAIHLQRPGLLLQNGVVYMAWASYCDNGSYHGWVLGYNASTLAQVSKFNDTPNGTLGGIWMSGAGPASDSAGNVYVITGNGTFDANTAGGTDFGDSFLKLSSSLSVVDWFTPFNEDALNNADQDVGGGGSVLLLDNPGGPNAHLLVGGGKEGKLYVVNRDTGMMGHFNSADDSQIVQSFSPSGNGIFATPVFWQNNLYIAPTSSAMSRFPFNTATGKFSTAAASQSMTTFSFPGATPSLSANGIANAILWAIQRPSGGGTAVLHAYDASNLSELWNSSMAPGSRDQAGSAVKFTVPTVANGKVYIGAHGELDVYGLLP